jgi:uncharacterized membrane protein
LFEIAFYGAVVLFVLFGPWVLVWRGRRRRKQEREEDLERWRYLSDRVLELEGAVGDLKSTRAATPAEPRTQAKPVTVPKPVVEPTRPLVSEPIVSAPAVSASSVEVEAAQARVRATLPARSRAAPPPPLSSMAEPGPTFRQEPAPSLAHRFKSALDLEEALGTNWLNKLGIAILVLGVAFFLAYQLNNLGPAGKVLVGIIVSAGMLGTGLWFERNNRYRILARAGIGGGWALLFFVTYAAYHVPAAHMLSSQAVDLVLMLVVAAAMVWNTLRYRSQVVTGLAFLLAFLTVTISHVSVYSLSAGVVLAAGLVFIAGRMQWFELEIFGILASYLNHYLWLRPIIEPMHGKRHPFPEFAASAAILALYWVTFRVSYVLRQPRDDRKEKFSTVAALLNTGLLLALFKYQSAHPEWAFWALLAIGGIETVLAQLPVTRRRRSAVVVLCTIGVILLIAAFPFRYSGTRLGVLWLLEAEALLLIGVWTGEIVFRRLGALASLLVAGQMLSFDAARVLGMRMDGADVHSDFRLAIPFAVASAVFYANAHWVLLRWSDLFTADFDRRLMQRLSYVAALMAFVGTWIAYPDSWTAVAWCALGLLLTLAARNFELRELTYQAHFLALAAVIRVLAINFEDKTKFFALTLRLITVSIVSISLYATSRWGWQIERTVRDKRDGIWTYSWLALLNHAYTWSASFLIALLAWYELRSVSVAVAWVIGGLILFEVGFTPKSVSLRLQAYLLFLSAFLRIFFVNLNAAGEPGEISPRVYTVVPLALAFFYGYWRLQTCQADLLESDRRLKAPELMSYLGTITIASLMRFELEADWVAAAWAALVFGLLAIAWRSGLRVFLHQALLIGFAVLFRTILHNFYQRSYFPAPVWESRMIGVSTVVGLLFAALPFAFRVRRKAESSSGSRVIRILQNLGARPEQVIFFIAIGLLTVLLALEMRHGLITLSWGLEGVAIFMFALWVSERSFRLSGLGLLLLCAGKILVVDVWRLSPRDRYLTLIVLGSALLLVSFLYTRHREAIRQYL